MSDSAKTALRQCSNFAFAFLVGIAFWKWKGEEFRENVVSQAITNLGMVAGYLYARKKSQSEQ